MQLNIGPVSIPYFLMFLLIAGLVFGYFLWINRKHLRLGRGEKIFDIVIIFIVGSIIIGRLLYVLEHLEEFSKMSWSVYPFYYEPGAERIWFKQLPWSLVKFWDRGIDPRGILLGNLLSLLWAQKMKNLGSRFLQKTVKFLCIANIIEIAGFGVAQLYFGKTIQSEIIGIVYSQIDNNQRFPLQGLEILILVLLVLILLYFKNIRKKISYLGVYLFAFGWLQIFSLYIQDNGAMGLQIGFSHVIFLLLVLLGIINFIFSVDNTEPNRLKIEESMPEKPVHASGDLSKQGKLQYSYKDFRSRRGSLSFSERIKTLLSSISRKLTLLIQKVSKG